MQCRHITQPRIFSPRARATLLAQAPDGSGIPNSRRRAQQDVCGQISVVGNCLEFFVDRVLQSLHPEARGRQPALGFDTRTENTLQHLGISELVFIRANIIFLRKLFCQRAQTHTFSLVLKRMLILAQLLTQSLELSRNVGADVCLILVLGPRAQEPQCLLITLKLVPWLLVCWVS